jgi:hypothetical protein
MIINEEIIFSDGMKCCPEKFNDVSEESTASIFEVE